MGGGKNSESGGLVLRFEGTEDLLEKAGAALAKIGQLRRRHGAQETLGGKHHDVARFEFSGGDVNEGGNRPPPRIVRYLRCGPIAEEVRFSPSGMRYMKNVLSIEECNDHVDILYFLRKGNALQKPVQLLERAVEAAITVRICLEERMMDD